MRTLLFGLMLTLTGCATTWTKDGGTEQTFNDDKLDCELISSKEYPQNLVQKTYGGGYLPTETTCQSYGNTTNCTSYPGAYIPPRTKTFDANDKPRRANFERCMRGKGYVKHRS